MTDFLASLHPIAWLAIGAAAVALIQLPKALGEFFRRPWHGTDEPDARRKQTEKDPPA